MIGAGEIDRQLQRADVEVHRVVVEVAQVLARRTVDVRAALFECVKAAVEPLDEVRNRAAEVAERPLDVGKALDDAAEDEARGGECRVEREADERHQPIVRHRFDADGRSRMNVNHRAELVRRLPHRPEPLVAQRDAVDVAEDHRAGEVQLFVCAPKLDRGRRRIAQRQRGDANVSSTAVSDDRRKAVVHEPR